MQARLPRRTFSREVGGWVDGWTGWQMAWRTKKWTDSPNVQTNSVERWLCDSLTDWGSLLILDLKHVSNSILSHVTPCCLFAFRFMPHADRLLDGPGHFPGPQMSSCHPQTTSCHGFRRGLQVSSSPTVFDVRRHFHAKTGPIRGQRIIYATQEPCYKLAIVTTIAIDRFPPLRLELANLLPTTSGPHMKTFSTQWKV